MVNCTTPANYYHVLRRQVCYFGVGQSRAGLGLCSAVHAAMPGVLGGQGPKKGAQQPATMTSVIAHLHAFHSILSTFPTHLRISAVQTHRQFYKLLAVLTNLFG